MSAGPKHTPEKSLFVGPIIRAEHKLGAVEGKTSMSQPDSLAKDDKHEGKTGFGQANYYRQGVLVPGGPGKRPMARGRSR